MNNYDKIVELYHRFGDREEDLKIFYANDYPIPYKNLKLFPVQVDLYYYFHILVQCLLLPHKTSGDAKAISMSYLKYLCYLATEKQQPEYITFLSDLLLIVLKKEEKYIDEYGKEKYTLEINLDAGTIQIENEIYNSKDFDKIKNIILEQNALEPLDETINPELLKAFREREEYMYKQSKVKLASFEDQINIVVAKSSYRRDEIVRMTIRSFSRLLQRIDKIMDYAIKSILLPYMDDKDKKNIDHYLSNTDKTLKEKCESMFTDMNTLKKKVEGNNMG